MSKGNPEDFPEFGLANRAGKLLRQYVVWADQKEVDTDELRESDNYFQPDLKIGPPPKNWLSKHKSDVISLFVECAQGGIIPPDDLQEVGRLILGKNVASVWGVKKYDVLENLAQNFPPPKIGAQIPLKITKHAAERIIGAKGIRKPTKESMRGTKYTEHLFRKTFLYWCQDPHFLEQWAVRHKFYKNYKPDKKILKIIREIDQS